MLLDIYLRLRERTVSISFLEAKAAEQFFRHVKRQNLYIRGRKVDVRWNERQFILPGHVANKISIGATRNLIIFDYDTRHTEEAIRNDLEHIHNLVVIKVTFSGRNAYISLNSVHNAMFARTCMMSCSVYKGLKIEWGVDECDSSLKRPPQSRNEGLPKKKNTPLVNRFQLLDIDGTEDGSTDNDNNTTNGVTLLKGWSPK